VHDVKCPENACWWMPGTPSIQNSTSIRNPRRSCTVSGGVAKACLHICLRRQLLCKARPRGHVPQRHVTMRWKLRQLVECNLRDRSSF